MKRVRLLLHPWHDGGAGRCACPGGRRATSAAASPMRTPAGWPLARSPSTPSPTTTSRSGNLPAQKHANGHIDQGITNIDSIPNFSGKYHADGFDPSGTPNKQWVYNTVGALPQHGGTTTIRVPIIPVSLDLLAPDGSVLVHVDANHDVPPTLNSPLFQNATYSSSSTPTQFNDAIQRAEFASSAKSDWHTLLQPVVEPGVTLEMPWGSFGYAVWPSGPQAGQIAYVLLDGATVDNLMFPTTTYSWPPDTQHGHGGLGGLGGDHDPRHHHLPLPRHLRVV